MMTQSRCACRMAILPTFHELELVTWLSHSKGKKNSWEELDDLLWVWEKYWFPQRES